MLVSDAHHRRHTPLPPASGAFRRGTRPTSDRLRETLFNVLAPRVEGAAFLDLYAGSGAVGIEALSRGARSAEFVEQGSAAIEVLRANLARLGVGNLARIHPASVAKWLRRAAAASASGLAEPSAKTSDEAAEPKLLAGAAKFRFAKSRSAEFLTSSFSILRGRPQKNMRLRSRCWAALLGPCWLPALWLSPNTGANWRWNPVTACSNARVCSNRATPR